MISRSLKWRAGVFFTFVLAALFVALPAARAQVKSKVDLKKDIPKRVMDALKARFPNAEIQTWTQEKDGGVVLYDIEFKQGSRKFEADIKEDGTIDNWENEIPATDLPAAVRKTVNSTYPNAGLKEVMAVTAVRAGKDTLEGYEVTLETTGKKTAEITVAPDGKILEVSGEKQ